MPLRDVSSEADPEAAALAFMQRRFEEPFALEGKPLFRYDLIKLADDHYYWLLQYHHLSIDGWGVALLNRSWGRSTAPWPPQRLPIWRLPPTRPTSKTTGPMSNRRSLSSSGPFGDNTILRLSSDIRFWSRIAS